MPSAVDPADEARQRTSAPAIELAGVTRRFGDFVALAGIDLAIQRGEFFSILGPSGCGKTTLLRVVAGLDRPDAGTVRLGGRESTDLPAHRRPVNTVFQSYALFPHLNVRENVAFGLRMKRVAPVELDRRVAAAMELVEIVEVASRHPGQLSGGQKQRVALARALVNEPEVLLLDEPLGALDLKLRRQLQLELRGLQRRLGITFVHVTHDQDEALAISDRIAVMNTGRLEQVGEARQIYERPRTRFVAQFLGSCNLLEGTVSRVEAGALRMRTPMGELEVPFGLQPRRAPGPWKAGDPCTVAMRPELAILAGAASGASPPGFAVRVVSSSYRGSDTEFTLAGVEGVVLKARVVNGSPGNSGLRSGDAAAVHWPPSALVLLEE